MRKIKFLVCISMITIILCNSFCMTYASVLENDLSDEERRQEEETADLLFGKGNWEWREDPLFGYGIYSNSIDQKFMEFIALGFGVSGNLGPIIGKLSDFLTPSWFSEMISSGNIVADDEDLKISKEAMEKMHNSFYDVVTPLNGYYLMEPNIDASSAVSLPADLYNDRRMKLSQLISSYGSCFIRRDPYTGYAGERFDYCFFDSDMSFYIEYNYFKPCEDKLFPYVVGINTNNGVFNEYFDHSKTIAFKDSSDTEYSFYLVGAPFKIFYSRMDWERYKSELQGLYTPQVYTGTSFFNYIPSTQKIPLNTYNTNDWSKINESTYSNIVNQRNEMIASDGSISEAALRDIIDINTQEIIDSIGSVQDEIKDTNMSLDEIKNQITSSGKNTIAWLSKIYNLLSEKLDIIIKKIEK